MTHFENQSMDNFNKAHKVIDDYAKDGGKELFTEMHCVL